jgi:hypothetical protein
LSDYASWDWKDAVHDGGAVFDDRSDLLAVDEFGDGCAAVADEPRDLLDQHAA